MKTTYRPDLVQVHLKLEYKDKASEEMSDVFHAAMRRIDRNYPLNPLRGPDEGVKTCLKCHGVVWDRPQPYMEPKILKVLAKQLGIKVKVVSFLEVCSGGYHHAIPTF